MNVSSEEEMGGIMVCDKVYLCVVLTSSLLFYGKSSPLWLVKLQDRGFMTIKFLLENQSLRR